MEVIDGGIILLNRRQTVVALHLQTSRGSEQRRAVSEQTACFYLPVSAHMWLLIGFFTL